MSENVQFEDDKQVPQMLRDQQILYGRFQPSTERPAMIKIIMRLGIKSDKVATGILLVVTAGALLTSFFLLYNSPTSPFASGPHLAAPNTIHLPPKIQAHLDNQ